jgi:dTDP-4-amino-4,6-dideoxygalactose transaminase
MERIKFINLRPMGHVASLLNVGYDRVFNSSTYIGGKEVEAFEKEWAEYCGTKHCVGVGNGFDALRLSCKYFRVLLNGAFVDTFVPWKTCIPTWAAVEASGCTPNPMIRFAYVLYVAVHIYGRITLPNYGNACLVEDCAQAHGATLNGIKAGKFGKASSWSFYPSKNLGALGDAGAVTTDDDSIAEYIREQSHYGTTENYGINSRLDPLQAAFLRAKLPYLDKWNERRTENAQAYFDTIIPDKVKLPYTKSVNDKPCWHIFAIETDNREDLIKYLRDMNIETMVHYPSVPYPKRHKIPEAEEWAKRTLSLPIAPHVVPEQCRYIGNLINQWGGL